MQWNWQQKDWPNFNYNQDIIRPQEDMMLLNSGILLGAFAHLSDNDKDEIKIEIISNEALKTSAIEGEYLNRDSLQSSILRHFGLKSDGRKETPAEKAISALMIDLYTNYQAPLSHQTLFHWHQTLMSGLTDLHAIGCYRSLNEPMQIISGSIHEPKVHFEAPPAQVVNKEMEEFIIWFNNSSLSGTNPLPILTRASIAHLYFESIHPFEDGNGRIGRAIAEKALSQSLKQPTLIALSTIIEKNKKAYYAALEQATRSHDITKWINYFSSTILDAQNYTLQHIEFLIKKTKFYEAHKNCLNNRQAKAIERILREGPKGFNGGLSAENYIAINNTSRATATRDLRQLLEQNILTKRGERRYTRYYLVLPA